MNWRFDSFALGYSVAFLIVNILEIIFNNSYVYLGALIVSGFWYGMELAFAKEQGK